MKKQLLLSLLMTTLFIPTPTEAMMSEREEGISLILRTAFSTGFVQFFLYKREKLSTAKQAGLFLGGSVAICATAFALTKGSLRVYDQYIVGLCESCQYSLNNSYSLDQTLFIAIRSGNSNGYKHNSIGCIKELLKRGAQINGTNTLNDTPLLHAIKHNNIEAVKMLTALKADINKTDSRGNTPLMVAVDNNRLAMVQFLLDSGADITPTATAGTHTGMDALGIATQKNYQDIVTLLNNYRKTALDNMQGEIARKIDTSKNLGNTHVSQACASLISEYAVSPDEEKALLKEHQHNIHQKTPIQPPTKLFNVNPTVPAAQPKSSWFSKTRLATAAIGALGVGGMLYKYWKSR